MATGSNQAFCLRRNNHTSDMMDYFEKMFKEENLVDVTLSCEEGTIKAHKIILSACSPYFRSIFSKFTNPFQYPVIFMKDMPLSDLKAIIEFVYRGEVTVPQEQLSSVLKSAEALKVKGLSDVNCGKGLKSAEGTEGLGSARKRRKKRRKMCRNESGNSQQLTDHNQSEEDDEEGSKRSSDDNSEYTDEDDEMQQHQSSGTDITPVLSGRTETGRFNETNSTVEGDIEPARLLEQSMITGDRNRNRDRRHVYTNSPLSHIAQENGNTVPRFSSSVNMSNVQSITSVGSQGLMPGMAGSLTGSLSGNDANSIQASGSQNHLPTVSAPCSLSAFDSSGLSSMPGPSSMSQVVSRPSQPAQEQRSYKRKSSSSKSSVVSRLCSSAQYQCNKQRFHCHLCHQGFTAKRNLQRHMQIHSYYRNKFECEICRKIFSWKHTLNSHKEKAHNINV